MQNNVLQFIHKIPKQVSLILCLIVAVIIGIIDYVTGDYGITVVYIIPIYLAAKLLGKMWCHIATSLCLVEIISVALFVHLGHISLSEIYIWNVVMQSLELVVLGYCISRVTRTIE